MQELIDKILDADLNLNAKALGLEIKGLEQGESLNLNIRAGFPAERLKESYLPKLHHALKQTFPTKKINFELDSFIQAHRTQLLGQGLRGVKNTLAIASGKGGVGKSTLTVNLALALAKMGANVGILDADIYGPSIPLMLGKAPSIESTEEGYLPAQIHGIKAMSIAYLMQEEQALIWRGPMLAKALLQMLDLTLWEELDYLFIDLPPGTGDIQLSLVQKIPLAGAIVVTTPQRVASLDAEKAIQMFQKTGIDVLGLVENMSIHHCHHCGHESQLFGHGGGETLAKTYQIPLLGQLPLAQEIQEDCDQGHPSSLKEDSRLTPILLRLALNTALTLAKRPLNYAGKFPPIKVEN